MIVHGSTQNGIIPQKIHHLDKNVQQYMHIEMEKNSIYNPIASKTVIVSGSKIILFLIIH